MIETFGDPSSCIAALRRNNTLASYVGNVVAALLDESEHRFVRVRVRHVPGRALEVEIAEVNPKTLVTKTEGPETVS